MTIGMAVHNLINSADAKKRAADLHSCGKEPSAHLTARLASYLLQWK